MKSFKILSITILLTLSLIGCSDEPAQQNATPTETSTSSSTATTDTSNTTNQEVATQDNQTITVTDKYFSHLNYNQS